MEDQSHSSRRDVAEAANRLRSLQTGLSDESPERQRDYLLSELGKIVQKIPYGRRRRFLEKLTEQFPTGSYHGGDLTDTSTSREPAPAGVPADPDALLATFAQVLPTLSDEKKAAFSELLRGSGATEVAVPAASDEVVEQVRSTLRLESDRDLRADRLAEIAGLLAEFALNLEQVIAGIWGKMSPRSRVRPAKNLRQLSGQFVTSAERDPTLVARELERLQWFTTGIVTGATRAGAEFARRCSNRISPDAIEGVVEMEQSRLIDLRSKEVRCWRKYCELAETLTQESVEKDIESAIGDYAEAFVREMERLR